MSSHPDSLRGTRRKVGWDKEEFTLNPGGSIWLSKPKAMPTIGCRVMTKRGTRALLTHGKCHKHETIPGRSLSAINSTCYWVKWLNPHLLLVSPWSDCSAATHDLKAQTRVKDVCSTSWWHLWMLLGWKAGHFSALREAACSLKTEWIWIFPARLLVRIC